MKAQKCCNQSLHFQTTSQKIDVKNYLSGSEFSKLSSFKESFKDLLIQTNKYLRLCHSLHDSSIVKLTLVIYLNSL